MSAKETRTNNATPENDQTEILIQILEDEYGGIEAQSSVDRFINAAPEQMEKVADTIENVSTSLVSRLQESITPNEMSIEFGINAGGEAGVPFVTKGTIGANFKITLKWVRQADK